MNSRVLHFPHGSFLKQGSQYYVVLLIDKRMYSTGVFVHPSRGGWRPQFSTTRNNDAIDHTARTFDGVFSSTVTNPYSSAPIDTFLRHNIEVGKGTPFDRQTLLQTRQMKLETRKVQGIEFILRLWIVWTKVWFNYFHHLSFWKLICNYVVHE